MSWQYLLARPLKVSEERERKEKRERERGQESGDGSNEGQELPPNPPTGYRASWTKPFPSTNYSVILGHIFTWWLARETSPPYIYFHGTLGSTNYSVLSWGILTWWLAQQTSPSYIFMVYLVLNPIVINVEKVELFGNVPFRMKILLFRRVRSTQLLLDLVQW